MVVSAMLFWTLASVDLAACSWGFGRHIEDVPGNTVLEKTRSVEKVLHYNFASMLLLSLCLCFAKLSIVVTIIRIFKATTRSTLQLVLRSTAFVVIVCCVCQFFFITSQCSPVHLSWNISELGTTGKCHEMKTALTVFGVLSSFTSVVIVLAPISSFMKLQMPLRQRLCLSALFLSGLLLVPTHPTKKGMNGNDL